MLYFAMKHLKSYLIHYLCKHKNNSLSILLLKSKMLKLKDVIAEVENQEKSIIIDRKKYIIAIVKFTFLIIAFLVSLQIMINAFKSLGADIIETIALSASNPFVAFFIGLLSTAIVQSSSMVTTSIVAIVAAGAVQIEGAVFVIMGANIGTTVTSTMVAMGHVTSKKEFRRAIAAATAHDFFNILTALILFPLEYYFQILSNIALSASHFFHTQFNGLIYFNPFFDFLNGFSGAIVEWFAPWGVLCLLIAFILLFLSIRAMVSVFSDLLISKGQLALGFFDSGSKSFLLGVVLTALVHSSSLMTSLIVPIVASNRLSLHKVIPFILGANVGTTLTALTAALAQNEAAVSIAFTHVLFNVLGTCIFLSNPLMYNLLMNVSRALGQATLQTRFVGVAYIALVFFILPFLLIYFSRDVVQLKRYNYIAYQKNDSKAIQKYLYQELNTQEKAIAFAHPLEKDIITYDQKDTLIFNDTYLLKNKLEGNCWKGKDEKGEYEICLEKNESLQILNIANKQLNVNIYRKTYQLNQAQKFYQIRYFIDMQRKLIVRYELYNEKGLFIEGELINSLK
ncbi:MAG: hypothetical protein EAZ55_10700 [Cytophagales bacterium]|nr:MAG: hypothetical protein EAZ55_10700 [Cytophagales bacterium]